MVVCDRKSLNFPCVYKMTCLKNNLIYVGRTICLSRRVRDHARTVKLYNDRHSPWWTKEFALLYGATDFRRDYKVEVLEYLDGYSGDELLDKLDEREIYWIDKLNATNREIGFNTSSGGQGAARPVCGRYKSHGYIPDMYIAFDIRNGNCDLFVGLDAIDEEYSLRPDTAKNSQHTFNLADQHLYVMNFDVLKREKKMKAYNKTATNAIEEMHKIHDIHESQLIQELIHRMEDYCYMEETIYRRFPYEPCSDYNTIKRLEYWKSKIKYWKVRLSTTGSAFIPSSKHGKQYEEAVAVYNVETKEVLYYKSMEDAWRHLNISKFNFYKKMRRAFPIRGDLMIYYIDDDAAKAQMAAIKKNCLESPEGRSRFYQYYCGYLKTRCGGAIFGE